MFAGNQMRRCDLRGADTADGYLEIIAAYAREHPDEAWITGGGWAMAAFPGGIPTRQALDAVTGDRPAFLPNRDGHGSWVNSAALRLAGIDASTPDPADGRIERDERGEPVGMLQEGAAGLVSRLVPVPTAEDWYQALLTAQDYLLSLGITGWQDAIIGRHHGDADPMVAYLRAAQAGTLHATVVGALWWDRDGGLEQLPELLDQRDAGSAGQAGPGGRFRATSVKMMLDGVAENHTAAMLEPYLDGDGCATGQSGLDFIDPEQLPGYVTALDREGFQVHFHALGDRAVRNALDAVAAARSARSASGASGPGGRHHLAHLQVVHPDDVPRFAALGATANIQALWATHEPQMDELTIPFLGERRAGWQYPFRSLQASGASMCAGSDWPVSSPNPLWGAHVAVNRSLPATAGGSGADPFLPAAAARPARRCWPLTRRAAPGPTAWRRQPARSGRAWTRTSRSSTPISAASATTRSAVRRSPQPGSEASSRTSSDQPAVAGAAHEQEEKWPADEACGRRQPSLRYSRSWPPAAAGRRGETPRPATSRRPRAWWRPHRREPSRCRPSPGRSTGT